MTLNDAGEGKGHRPSLFYLLDPMSQVPEVPDHVTSQQELCPADTTQTKKSSRRARAPWTNPEQRKKFIFALNEFIIVAESEESDHVSARADFHTHLRLAVDTANQIINLSNLRGLRRQDFIFRRTPTLDTATRAGPSVNTSMIINGMQVFKSLAVAIKNVYMKKGDEEEDTDTTTEKGTHVHCILDTINAVVQVIQQTRFN